MSSQDKVVNNLSLPARDSLAITHSQSNMVYLIASSLGHNRSAPTQLVHQAGVTNCSPLEACTTGINLGFHIDLQQDSAPQPTSS